MKADFVSFDKELRANKTGLIIAGSILVIAGIILLLNFYITPAYLNIILVCTYLVISIVTLKYSFRLWFRKKIGFGLHIMFGALYFSVGCLFLLNFWHYTYSALAYYLIIFMCSYAIIGSYRLFISLSQALRNGWLWTLYCGLLNLLLTLFIFLAIFRFPFSALLISNGVDVVATGVALIALGVAAKMSIK